MTLKEYLDKFYPELMNHDILINNGNDMLDVDKVLATLPKDVWNWTHIVIHHSWTEDTNVNDWEGIRKYHKEVNGWKDIGYNFGLEYIGGRLVVQVGRPLTEQGAHTIGFNSNGIGICLIGNYDKVAPNNSQLDMLRYLILGLMKTYNIKIENILGHRETYVLLGKPVEKTCPGSMFDMDAFRKSIEI